MQKNREPSSQNDNERLFIYHGSRRVENPGGKPDGEIQRLVVVMVPLCRALAQEYATRMCLLRPFSLVRSPRICIKITALQLYDTEAAHSPNVTSPPSTSNLRGASLVVIGISFLSLFSPGRLWIIPRLRNDRAINSIKLFIFSTG